MGLLMTHESKGLAALIDKRCTFTKAIVINDLRDKMIYDKQYKTASSLIYSACVIVDNIDYRSYLNYDEAVQISVELGWSKGTYLNLIANVMESTESERYEFIFAAVINAVKVTNPSRTLSEEEQKAISDVLEKTKKYLVIKYI